MRLVYLGTPAVAVPPLRALVDAGHDVALVVTGPDRRRGRGVATSPSPVKAAALELGLAVTDRLDEVTDVGADLGVVVAYGAILRPGLLARLEFVNLHFSLLPRWRGAAPVEWAILAGDERTGVCVMAVEEGLDSGGVYARAETDVDEKTLGQLWDELAHTGARLLVEVLEDWPGRAEAQQGEVTHAPKLTGEDRRLRWDRTAPELARLVRLGDAWTTLEGERFKVRSARAVPAGGDAGSVGQAGEVSRVGERVEVLAGSGALELIEVQPSGRAPMPARDWLAGRRDRPTRLGS